MKKLSFVIGLIFVFFAQDLWAQPTGRRIDVNDPGITATQKANLAAAMLTYINKPIVDEHSCNNEFGNANGASGSIHGPEMFLNWHRNYLTEMEADPGVVTALAAITGSNGLLPRWTQAFGLATVSDFTAVDSACPTICGGGPSWECDVPTGTGINSYPFTNPLPCTWTDFDDFSEILRTGYHNNGHGQLGGAMGTFKSPITPIFWLWHAMIDDVYWDYQNDCINSGDLHVKDTPSDNASEPNNISTTLYQSQDIWVRENQDTPTGGTNIPHGSTSYANEGMHENPEYKTSGFNYIYVRVRNDSPDEFAGGRMRVYWSKASTGLNWPNTWNDHVISGVLHGDEVTPDNGPGIIPPEANVLLPPIPAGGQFIVEFPWVVPEPDAYLPFGTDIHHFCLLARLISPFDEMDTAEGSTLWLNVKNNNNIAWKNVQIYNADPFNIVDPGGNAVDIAKQVAFMGVYVSNFTTDVQVANLKFEAEKGDNGTFYDIGGRVYARMSKELFTLWEQAGFDGENIEIIGEYEEKYYVEMLDPDARMKGLALDARRNYALEMGYALTKQAKEGQTFGYDVRQNDGNDPVGGERYEIRIEKPRIRSNEAEALAFTQLSVAPNPAKDQFTVSYELQAEGKVSMTLFDINGRMVNHLAMQTMPAGSQTSVVDVSELPVGIYILKLQVGQQIVNQKVIVE